MIHRTISPIFMFFFVLTLAAQGDQEPNCPQDADLMERLHKHAFLEHYAFRPTEASPSCSGLPDVVDTKHIHFFPPVSHQDSTYWQSVVKSESFDAGEIAVFILDDGPSTYPRYFLACSARAPFRLVISLSISIRHAFQWIGVSVGPQYTVHILGELAVNDKDHEFLVGRNIETTALRNVHTNEEIFLIRGTQAEQLFANLSTILYDQVFNNQCPFEFASAAVKHIAKTIIPENCQDGCNDPRKSTGVGPLSIVGHSLGGSAVQHVANDYANDPYSYGNIVMDSYSFNSYGAEYSHHANNRAVSYCTYDDFACNLFGSRYQPGTNVIYDPGNGSSSDHGIKDVQGQLCNCRYGSGAVEITSP